MTDSSSISSEIKSLKLHINSLLARKGKAAMVMSHHFLAPIFTHAPHFELNWCLAYELKRFVQSYELYG